MVAPSQAVRRRVAKQVAIRTKLELAGIPIGGNDLLIAAQAMARDHTLVTDNDNEFARIDELSVENWLRDK